MKRHGGIALTVAAVALAILTVVSAASGQGRQPVELAMISPLTGPLSFVGQDNRAGVLAAVREINRAGGIRGRQIRLTIFDDGSNPSQGVVRIRRIALMNDNGGFGQEGQRNVKELASRFGFQIVEEITFPLTSTSFTAELTRVKNSNAQALWLWNATTLAVTITKEAKQLGLNQRLVFTGGNASPLFLGPACPEANGALINTYLGPVAPYVKRTHPSRAIALRVNRLLGKQGSTFNYDGYTAIRMFRDAMLKGGFTRARINNALETRMKGFAGPGGRYFYSAVNHSGLQTASMVVSSIRNCRMVPVPGQKILQATK